MHNKQTAVRKRFIPVLCIWIILAGCGTEKIEKSGTEEIVYKEATEDKAAAAAAYDMIDEAYAKAGDEARFTYHTEEIWCNNNGQKIYGVAYIPDTEGPVPLVIHAHELGVSHTTGIPYAERLAQAGYAVYLFDFRGGTVGGNNSDGDTVGMSVMTEVSDLEAVLSEAASWDFADPEKVFLLGGSQGGLVTALTGCRNPDRVAGMVLLYPAFHLPLDIHDEFGSPDRIPEEFDLYSYIHVGRNYAEDIWDLDVFQELFAYTGPVLLLHGDMDQMVDLSLVEKAAEILPEGELHVLKGAGHGFANGFTGEALEYILEFMKTWC